ncbi:hypothetical protein BC826DRAFT_25158 [Russula brevipes]|nr:hypothetical protein BC826DRAFT_25158 [Russula brevipes]
MGSICSKSSTHTGGHTLVSPAAGAGQSQYGAVAAGRPSQASRSRSRPPNADARRSQAAAAAEQRMKTENKRGVSAANPKAGRLAASLEASRVAPLVPEPTRREDTLIMGFFFWKLAGRLEKLKRPKCHDTHQSTSPPVTPPQVWSLLCPVYPRHSGECAQHTSAFVLSIDAYGALVIPYVHVHHLALEEAQVTPTDLVDFAFSTPARRLACGHPAPPMHPHLQHLPSFSYFDE